MCVTASSQTYTLPYEIIDSMIYEVKKGRACDSLQKAQYTEITKLNEESMKKDGVIHLQSTENENLSFLLNNANSYSDRKEKEHKIDKNALKTKIKGLTKIIFGETVFVILLIILL